jgi:hypothetical protein
MDNGNWFLLVFNAHEEINRFDINKAFGMNNDTIPISGFT